MAGKCITKLLTEVSLHRSRLWLPSSLISSLFTKCSFSQILNRVMGDSNAKRNVEIKAFLGTDDDYQAAVEVARKLTSTDGEIIKQRDVFFKSQQGRLKLRYLQNGEDHLIYYSRNDVEGPKLSTYYCTFLKNAEEMEHILTMCNGTRGIVEKNRLLFIHKNTRIHLDKVTNLGNYLEFEVMLDPEDKIEDGQAFADKLMAEFQIKKENLITGAYVDLLIERDEKNKV